MMPSGPKMTFYMTKIAFLEVKMCILGQYTLQNKFLGPETQKRVIFMQKYNFFI